ncbi:hypothetical protein LXL04_029256 [Taraxacum kok-saghyz]
MNFRSPNPIFFSNCRSHFLINRSFPWGSITETNYDVSGNHFMSSASHGTVVKFQDQVPSFQIWIWEMLPQLSLINAGKLGTFLPMMVQWVQVKGCGR